jgi:hypothetical protein
MHFWRITGVHFTVVNPLTGRRWLTVTLFVSFLTSWNIDSLASVFPSDFSAANFALELLSRDSMIPSGRCTLIRKLFTDKDRFLIITDRISGQYFGDGFLFLYYTF